MKKFKTLINQNGEIHIYLSSNEEFTKFPIHKSLYQKLNDKDKNVFFPTEFCFDIKDAKDLINDLQEIVNSYG